MEKNTAKRASFPLPVSKVAVGPKQFVVRRELFASPSRLVLTYCSRGVHSQFVAGVETSNPFATFGNETF